MSASKRELRKFGMLMGTTVPLLFGALLPWFFKKPNPLWPWILGGIFWGLAMVFPLLLRPVHILWLWIGSMLALLNSRIVLGAAFFLLITPVGLVVRLFRRDCLKLKWPSNDSSCRVFVHETGSRNMETPY